MNAKLYYTHGLVLDVAPANGITFTLKEAQKLVGGFVEIIYLDNDEIMLINEEGKLMQLDKNEKATQIMQSQNLGHFPNDYIAGKALICKRKMFE